MEKAVTEYGNDMEMTPDIKSAGQDIATVQKTMSGTRFQLWQSTSQTGTYSIDENISKQVFEMTCTETKVCKREETTKGSGAIPPPPGSKSIPAASMLEVDSTGRDMMFTLPMPLVPLPVNKTVTTTIMDDDAKGGPGFARLSALPDNKPVTNAYTRRLQLYRGEIGPEAVVTAADTDEVQVATLAYGLGNWYLVRGDKAQARAWFERSVQSGGWPAFGFIASEAELRRLR